MATPSSPGIVQPAVDHRSAGLPATMGLADTGRFDVGLSGGHPFGAGATRREIQRQCSDHPLAQACGAAAVCPQDPSPGAARQRPQE